MAAGIRPGGGALTAMPTLRPLRDAELRLIEVTRAGTCPAAWLRSVLRPLGTDSLRDLTDRELRLIAQVGPLPGAPIARTRTPPD